MIVNASQSPDKMMSLKYQQLLLLRTGLIKPCAGAFRLKKKRTSNLSAKLHSHVLLHLEEKINYANVQRAENDSHCVQAAAVRVEAMTSKQLKTASGEAIEEAVGSLLYIRYNRLSRCSLFVIETVYLPLIVAFSAQKLP
ncbi:hypothetical protein T05_3015 [Trichinella murrelli]|uniref:Uncharacterized protein n=1 Tax=Trichinella murrelli TaxID=144512 RepID=A0A0V0TZH0_9BILA|nr:hypothetical protein T05_3015 [Trichinella murrelli]